MTSEKIIDNTIPSIKPDDTCNVALSFMDTLKLLHLPVVDKGDYLGLISEDEIYDKGIFGNPVKSVGILACPFVLASNHVFEALNIMVKYNISIVPVLNKNKKYIGSISVPNLLKEVSSFLNVSNFGAIIILEMGTLDYSMSEIARIVESENGKILSSYLRYFDDSTRINITLVIGKTEISPIIKSFERYGYKIDTFFCEDNLIDDFYKDRYEFLVNYMKI